MEPDCFLEGEYHPTWGEPARVRTELVELRRADGAPVDALWYGADTERTAILHVHGKGSSVLSGPSRFLPPLMPEVAHLAINMRCHDLAYTVGTDDFAVEGGMWEDLSTGHLDLEAGVAFLGARGVEKIVVCGHSSGGFYAADLVPRVRRIAGWILLSPLTSNKFPFPMWFPTEEERVSMEKRARAMVAAGQGAELLPLPAWFHAISAASLVQRFDEPEGVWLANIRRATAPVLMAWGEAETRDRLWSQLYKAFAGPRDRKLTLAEAGHYYRGHEHRLAAEISRFLNDVGVVGNDHQ